MIRLSFAHMKTSSVLFNNKQSFKDIVQLQFISFCYQLIENQEKENNQNCSQSKSYNIFEMLSGLTSVFCSEHNFYLRSAVYEIWAHLGQASLIIQLKSFCFDRVKIFEKTINSLIIDNKIISSKTIFKSLSVGEPVSIDLKKGNITIQIKQPLVLKNPMSLQISLDAKENQAPIDSMIIFDAIKQQNTEICRKLNIFAQQEMEILPIVHDHRQYKFKADLDLDGRSIMTELTLKKQQDKEGRLKDKAYESSIEQKGWPKQYSQKFKNIETLFEHLRKQTNYEIIQQKGLIKITNEPQQIFPSIKRLRKKKNQPQSLEILKQMQQIKQKLQNKLTLLIKQSQKGENVRHEGRIASLQKQLRAYLKKKSKETQQKIKVQINKLIQDYKNEMNAANMRKSHFIEARSRAGESQQEKIEKLKLSSMEKQKKILIQKQSSQIEKFVVRGQNLLIYKGTWDWTQIFTNISIDIKGIYEIKFKIVSTTFSAIAIGVSDIKNNEYRSSLNKPNSISYWGDSQIWQGYKIKEQGQGYNVGQTIAMQVNRGQGYISWYVDDILQAKHYSKSLENKNIHFRAYLQMYDQQDGIEMVSYKHIKSD